MPIHSMQTKLLLGGGFLGDDAIVLRGALNASTNLFTSWIVSHRVKMVPSGSSCGKESLLGEKRLNFGGVPRQAGNDER